MKRWLAHLVALAAGTAAFATEIGEDRLHKQPWFRDTEKILREDLSAANAEGKRLMIFVEQPNCIYCIYMHQVVFAHPDVSAYIEDNFFALQMNLVGAGSMTDFDGDARSEQRMGRKWGLVLTPTTMFFPERVPQGLDGRSAAVAIIPGAMLPHMTLDLLTWANEGRYEEESFPDYHRRVEQERIEQQRRDE